MIIVHKIDSFLLELFPNARGVTNSKEALAKVIEEFYSHGLIKPKVSIEGETVVVEIDIDKTVSQVAHFKKAVSLCEEGKYNEAKAILLDLLHKDPTNSEYYRIYGQVLSDQGNTEEAINYLIDSLRWDPKNGSALTMMGNIYARDKNDFETARKYYDQSLELNPKDNVAINNLGFNLVQLGRVEEGLEYLRRAYTINPQFPNSSYGIALANEMMGDHMAAFNFAITALRNSKPSDQIAIHSLSLLIRNSESYIKSHAGYSIFEKYKSYVEQLCGREIIAKEDGEISTAAKIEIAENYNRVQHIIKYKPSYKAVEHLIMHELVHLMLIANARKENLNKLFVTNGDLRSRFIKDYDKDFKKMVRKGIPEKALSSFIDVLFDGINLQIYNAPIDLFIEDYLYENYTELRPYQFVSLYSLLAESISSVTDRKVIEVTPEDIYFANKVLNLVSAIHFKELFGVDLIARFDGTSREVKKAYELYEEFNEYRKDREPSEEYELVQHWGDDLKISKYFELVDEQAIKKRSDNDNILEQIERDPFEIYSNQDHKKTEMDNFLRSQEEIGLNMAVVMFMVDALQYFNDKPTGVIKDAALEIAMLGLHGINPHNGSKYKLASVPQKEFSGYHLLAYYYVSWFLAIPEMLAKLELPYEKEFDLANKMFKK